MTAIVGWIVRVCLDRRWRSRVAGSMSAVIAMSTACPAVLPATAAPAAPAPARTAAAKAAPTGAKQVNLPRAGVKPGSKQFGLTTVGDKWAVVIGVSQFADGSIPPLKYAAKDAKDFYDYLIDPAKGGFKPDHVKLLINEDATKLNIEDSVGDTFLPHAAMDNDLVVFFLSTHGSPAGADVQGINYVIAYDTNLKKPNSTGVNLKLLMSSVKGRVHGQKVIVLDTCYSGAGAEAHKGLQRTGINAAALSKSAGGSVLITSSSANERSWESDQLHNSYFTRYFIDTLSSPTKPNVSDAFNQMKSRVQSNVLHDKGEMQTPQMQGGTAEHLSLSIPSTENRESPYAEPTITAGNKRPADLAGYGDKMRTANQLILDHKLDRAIKELREAVAMNPLNIEGYIAQADVYDASHDYGSALASARNAVKNGGEEAKTHVRLARAYFRQNQMEYALGEAKTAISLDPENSQAHYWNGYINQIANGKVDLAEQEYRQALELDSLNDTALVTLARLLKDQNRELDTIDQYYRKAIAANDDNWEARWELAKWMAAQKKDYKGAEQEIRKAIAIYPHNPLLNSELANIISQSGDKNRLPEADSEYQKALQQQDSTTLGYPHFVYARFLADSRGQTEEAEKEYRTAIKLEPDLDEARVLFGDLLVKKRVFDEADDQYRKALAKNPKNADAYLGLAQIQVQLYKNYNSALVEIGKALALKPSFCKAQDLMGTVLDVNLGRHDEARKAFEAAIKSDPKAAEPHYHLGMLMLEDVKKRAPDAVMEQFQAAANLSPNTAIYHTRLGYMQAEFYKKFKEAEAEYRKAIDLDIGDSEAHYRLGMLLIEKFNQRKPGEKELRTAYEQNPKNPEIKAAFERFAQ